MSWLVQFDGNADEIDLLSSMLWDLGTTGIAELGAGNVVAGFETEADAVTARDALGRGTVSVYDPSQIPAPAPSSIDFRDRRIKLIDTTVFGHGSHPTTRLALRALETSELSGRLVLDFGCGTGVLGIAACLAGAEVTGIDNDPTAIRSTEANAHENGCRIELLREAPNKKFDLVIANMLLSDQRDEAETIQNLLAPMGRLITTGFLHDQEPDVLALYPSLNETAKDADGEWTLLELSA